MIVELHNKLGNPQRIEATRVVLRCPINGVIAVALEPTPGHQYIIDRGDGDEVMNKMLSQLGINETVISDHIDKDSFAAPPKGSRLWKPGEDPPHA